MPNLSPRAFIGSLKGQDLTRGNLFEVIINTNSIIGLPASQANADTLRFKIKAAVIPEVKIGTATAHYNGRDIKLMGDREYSPVTLTSYLDKPTWEVFCQWIEIGGGAESNTASFDSLPDYALDIQVNVLNRKEEIIQEIVYVDSWIQSMGEVTLDWSSKDEISEVELTFELQSFKVDGVTR